MLDKSKLSNLSKRSTERTLIGNVSPAEIARFDQLAQSWWDPNGQYKTALEFNRARVEYFISQICAFYGRNPDQAKPLQGLRVLDVGCGGGLVCEPLARAGASVVGIDVSEMSVQVARRHALKSGLDIEYRHEQARQTCELEQVPFDVVINAEVIEHVPDQAELVRQCGQLCQVGGCVIMATLNRTLKSYLVGIVGAEYIMRYLPVGTHSWRAFVKPSELTMMANHANLQLHTGIGMAYNPLSKKWRTTANQSVNYVQIYQRFC